jgi:hypothetical protein
MKNLSALKNLVERGEAVPTDEDEVPKKPSSRYIGDVLDTLIASRHLGVDEVDDAASAIASNAEDGYEAVVDALIKKGHVPGSKLIDGGHRRLREKVRGAMREMVERGARSMLEEARGRRNMTERQRTIAERIEEAFRESVHDVLKAEGYAPLDVDQMTAEVRSRIRGIANRIAVESGKRSMRPLRD